MKNFVDMNTLTELMTCALSDMEALIDNPEYEFDYGNWHVPIGGKCHICTAGAVIAKRLVNSSTTIGYIGLLSFPEEVQCRLSAIDFLRSGDVYLALKQMGIDHGSKVGMCVPDAYFKDDKSARRFIKWWRDEGLAKLEKLEVKYTH